MTVTWTTAGWVTVIVLQLVLISLVSNAVTALVRLLATVTALAVSVQDFVHPADQEKHH